MTPTDIEFENGLRTLYQAVAPPPPPASWTIQPAGARTADRSTPTPAPPVGRPLWRNHWTLRGLAIAGAAAVALAATLTVSRHATPAPTPTTNPQTQLLSVQLLPAAANLNCSLPIVALSADETRGFIVLHNGHATFQPATVPQGAYIAALHQWVDGTPRRLTDADTTYYTAHPDPNALVITVHDSRSARVVYRGSPFANPMGWFGSDIVLFQSTVGQNGPSQQAHIQLLDPGTGALRTVPAAINLLSDFGANGSSTGYMPGSGAMWTVFSRDDGTRSTLDRYDLNTGATTRVYTSAGFIEMVGVDAGGNPIIQVAHRDIFHIDPAQRHGIATTTLLLTGAQQGAVLNHGLVGDTNVADNLSPLSLTDGDAVWMAADNGQIWLYTPQHGMQLIANVTTSTQGAPGVAIEGPCR